MLTKSNLTNKGNKLNQSPVVVIRWRILEELLCQSSIHWW